MPVSVHRYLRCGFLALIICSLLMLQPETSVAQPWVAATASVRAIGLGGAGSVIEDPWAGTRNPGALAPGMEMSQLVTAHNDNELSFSRLQRNTLIGIASPAFSLGSNSTAPRVIAAYAYRTQTAGIRDVPLTNGDIEDYIDELDYHTVSLAIDYYVQVGAGFTAIDAYNAVSEERTDAHDYGLFVRIPVLILLTDPRLTESGPTLGPLSPTVSIAAGYTWSSRNNWPEEDYPIADPLPNYNLFGLSFVGGLDYRDMNVVRVLYARDQTDTKSYFSNVRWGLEFSVFDAFALRLGDQEGGDNLTSGYSLHARGLAQWLYVVAHQRNYDSLPWYTSFLEVYYQHANTSMFGNSSSYDEIGFMLDARPLFAR